MSGRFAPSPTGPLHVGNLRTAVLAWLAARADGIGFIVRMEDLDRVQAAPEHERAQLGDLASIGLDWDGDVVRQSERFDLYRDALATLAGRGLVYECFCSRREVRAEIEAAPSAPHLPPGSYPGTCRELTAERRTAYLDDGRTPALRLRADASHDSAHDRSPDGSLSISFDDLVAGTVTGGVDDVVLRRNDGVPAYNLAVVVDDALQGVTQVVRGDDLLASTARQIHLQHLLDLPTPTYGHVPLVFGDDGERLSKRHGSVTLDRLVDVAISPFRILVEILRSFGTDVDGDLDGDLVEDSPAQASALLTRVVETFTLDSITRSEVDFTVSETASDGARPRFARRNSW